MHVRIVVNATLVAAIGLIGIGCGNIGQPDVEADVLAFEMPVAPAAAPPEGAGQVWAALEVEMCSNVGADDGAWVGSENWELELPDETRISPADRVVPGGPRPALEHGGLYALSLDECAEGWVNFAVPDGVRPEVAIFNGPDGSKRISLP